MKILLGNSAPIEVHHHDPDNVLHQWRLEKRGGQVLQDGGGGLHQIPLDPTDNHTTVIVHHGDPSVREAVADTLHLWKYHSAAYPGWVLVEDENTARGHLVQQILSDEWGLAVPSGPTMLVTNVGLDYAAAQLGGTTGAVAVYVGLTSDNTAPAGSDTVLAGPEYNHASAGLNRKAGAYAHTVGASTYTITVTFTANGSDVLPFTVNKAGFFTAASSGTMALETSVSPAITWNSSGDAGTLTETITV